MSTVIDRVDVVQSQQRRALLQVGAAAAGNAIYAATGIRLRQLPFDREILAGRRKA
jgi:hypothetical protein